MINRTKIEIEIKSKLKLEGSKSNIQIIHFDRIMVHEIVLQKQVLYLPLRNRFLSLERDW